MTKFKVGDIVVGNSDTEYATTCRGWKGEVIKVYNLDDGHIKVKGESGSVFDVSSEFFDLVKSKETIMPEYTNVVEKFKIALLPEPEKTFRKLGITNGDNLLTDDGKTLFLNFLAQKMKQEFMDEVVSKLVDKEDNK